MTLTEAINVIEAKNNHQKVSMIEYEDGTGKKFIYRLYGESKQRFIDLTNYSKKTI